MVVETDGSSQDQRIRGGRIGSLLFSRFILDFWRFGDFRSRV